MKIGSEILYLSNADVEALGIGAKEVEQALDSAFREKAAGRTIMKPKQGLHAPGGPLFLSMPAGILENPPYMGLKWVGISSTQERPDLPHISGLVILNDYETGMPVMAMDARWITGVRTAGITGIAARYMARPGAESVGFIACGVQARANLEALQVHFKIKRVKGYGRRFESAQEFCRWAETKGVEAEPVRDPRAAVEGMDIVVTSVPVVPPPPVFLDPAWLSPGSFVAMVDLGRPWKREGFARLDRVATDDLDQSGPGGEDLGFPRPYDAEVSELVAGSKKGRLGPDEVGCLLFAGPAFADVAVAALVYDRAKAAGRGTVLPL